MSSLSRFSIPCKIHSKACIIPRHVAPKRGYTRLSHPRTYRTLRNDETSLTFPKIWPKSGSRRAIKCLHGRGSHDVMSVRAFQTSAATAKSEKSADKSNALIDKSRVMRNIKRVLVANRGEISIRIQRACKEMGIQTISIYAAEDERALHRIISDESYKVGKSSATLKGADTSPVAAYLDQKEIIDLALRHKVDAIHPGYGFLSENGDFAHLVESHGIAFIGPSADAVHSMGDKVAARHVAVEAGIPVVPGGFLPFKDAESAVAICKEIGFPIMLKAAYGGGGRGMRRVYSENELAEAFERASSEARSAFGNGDLFVEKLVIGGRHIEVQVMGDFYGNIVHLLERDCSVQRRHQKVIEIAPAPFLDEAVRKRILEDAVTLMRHVKYQNAGTVEFLVEGDKHYFIEVNARLQVEHTITEEITGIDLVKTQIAVSSGKSLEDLNISQERIDRSVNTNEKGERGPVAIQCRITTEDSQQDFRPSTGPGIRLDGAIGASGAVISPHFDSLLVKLISRGNNFKEAVARADRALNETRIRGVITNIPFLKNVLDHPKFLDGTANVQFLDEHPELVYYDTLEISSQNICNYLAEVIVNGPHTHLVNSKNIPVRSAAILPPLSQYPQNGFLMNSAFGGGSWAGPPESVDISNRIVLKNSSPWGYKNLLDAVGPSEFAKKIRENSSLLLTDTTLRDAHQSLLATRLRTYDMLKIAPYYSHSLNNLFSLENWGGATYDVAYRFLRECPWRRLELLRENIPNIPFQMLLRGANAVGYTAYPDNAIFKFCEEAVKYGMDIFRIFDSLNYLDNLKLGIHDMAGLLTPASAKLLIGTLRKEFPDLPLHVHTHDTAGCGVASMLAAARAGADIVDVCVDSLSGLTSQPSMGALVASLKHSPLNPSLNLSTISHFSDYWERVRRYYGPFDCTDTLKSGSSDVYEHEIPGGQYTNLHMQAWSMGMADQWAEIKSAYKEANDFLGNPPKVTPTSKVVGDLAQFMVQNKIFSSDLIQKADQLSFPSSVVEYFQGYLGQHPFGFPTLSQLKVLKGAKILTHRPGESLPPVDWKTIRHNLEETYGRKFKETELLSSILYPKVFAEYLEFVKIYGDVSVLPTANYFVGAEPGETITINMAGREVQVKYIAKTHILDDGSRDVFFEVMGFPRTINVKDKNAKQASNRNMQADFSDYKQIGAPMPGTIISYRVQENEEVVKGQPLVVVSAMKMETVVVAPCNGIVASIPLKDGDTVETNDLLIKLT
ncbi:pyruvate carboxylase [Cardiosporidium cionae]|uniref:pyruvate carboxylase n=1 Tax=Cardiosporidium cionae TaxID=476202 RepID=A0ABQ7J5M7_9APIC|nr:pyruvate carboxylase [Cardiosporidium cionae]|eukprot:KAF8819263.1 pyruvate carboxylase [Cardiosporidium cionae]